VRLCRCEVEGMREDKGERKRGCGGGVSKRSAFFFSSSFLWLSTVFLFLEWKCKSRNRVSYCLPAFSSFFKSKNHCQVRTWLPSFKLGSQVRTWQSLRAELVESIPRQKNLAENYQLGTNTAKFELGNQVRIWHLARTWHELGSDQISRKWYISNSTAC